MIKQPTIVRSIGRPRLQVQAVGKEAAVRVTPLEGQAPEARAGDVARADDAAARAAAATGQEQFNLIPLVLFLLSFAHLSALIGYACWVLTHDLALAWGAGTAVLAVGGATGWLHARGS